MGKVSVGKPNVSGAVYTAVAGTTLPVTANESLAAAFKHLGYVSDAGLTNSNALNSEAIKAWGGDTVYMLHSDVTDTFQFVLLESANTDVLSVFYGSGNVSGTLSSGVTVKANKTDPVNAEWVFDIVLSDGVLKRIVLPNAVVSERGDVVYSDTEAIGYDVTLTAFPDSQGNTHYEYLYNGVTP